MTTKFKIERRPAILPPPPPDVIIRMDVETAHALYWALGNLPNYTGKKGSDLFTDLYKALKREVFNR